MFSYSFRSVFTFFLLCPFLAMDLFAQDASKIANEVGTNVDLVKSNLVTVGGNAGLLGGALLFLWGAYQFFFQENKKAASTFKFVGCILCFGLGGFLKLF